MQEISDLPWIFGKKRYPLTYVFEGKKIKEDLQSISSVSLMNPIILRVLQICLKRSKTRHGKENKETQRMQRQTKEGLYDYNDPWYDERHSNLSIIDNLNGSRLDRFSVATLWCFGNPLEGVNVKYVSTSISSFLGKR